MSLNITIQDFTGVYAEQPFIQELRKSAIWLDCTKIDGTDCYCDDEAQASLNKMMDDAIATAATTPGIHFFDNGNYHYMSKLWTDRVQEPFELVVFDHHPDMQPPRFEGILSCGGWVLEVLKNNPFVQSVTIIGVKDSLAKEIHEELSSSSNAAVLDKVKFICESELDSIGHVAPSRMAFNDSATRPIYISIDKDALSTSEAATNWDQGSLTYNQLVATLTALAQNHRILGIDICGERARDMDFADTSAADALNNALNEKLYLCCHAGLRSGITIPVSKGSAQIHNASGVPGTETGKTFSNEMNVGENAFSR